MPALVNISVGSLRGTSGEDGTISWPFRAKKFRKVDLMSLTLLMFIQSGGWGREIAQNSLFPAGTLLDKVACAVQKLCRRIIGLPHSLKTG
jgi:hypothetical protein